MVPITVPSNPFDSIALRRQIITRENIRNRMSNSQGLETVVNGVKTPSIPMRSSCEKNVVTEKERLESNSRNLSTNIYNQFSITYSYNNMKTYEEG